MKPRRQGPFDESRSQKALPDTGRTGDEQIVPVLDPPARAQGEDLGTVQTATMFEVDVFQRCGRVAQLGRAQASGELAVLPGRPFFIHQ